MNEFEGTLFNNDKKKTDNHPDLTGNAILDGEKYWLSAWRNTSKDGTKKYIKIKAKKAEPKPEEKKDDQSDLPF